MVASKKTKIRALRKAFKGVAEEKRFSRNSYHKISNHELLTYMNDHKIGTRWITEAIIRKTRRGMAKMYREKNGE